MSTHFIFIKSIFFFPFFLRMKIKFKKQKEYVITIWVYIRFTIKTPKGILLKYINKSINWEAFWQKMVIALKLFYQKYLSNHFPPSISPIRCWTPWNKYHMFESKLTTKESLWHRLINTYIYLANTTRYQVVQVIPATSSPKLLEGNAH